MSSAQRNAASCALQMDSCQKVMLLWLALVPLLVAGDPVVEYHAICDAGSTGTRLYVFALDLAAGKAESVFVKKTKPGLSSYVDDPKKAVAPLLQLLIEGSEKVPLDQRSKVPLLIFGTAGMRMLPKKKQDSIWASLIHVYEDKSYPFDRAHVIARTVSGDEEGLWAVLTTNFLTGRMGHDLLSHGSSAPLGLLDLGGSSTQIGIPSAAAAAKGINFSDGVMVKSYLGFGMTHIREEVRKESSDGTDSSCYMKGTPVDGRSGTGDGSLCRRLINRLLQQKSQTCRLESAHSEPCLGDLSSSALEAVQGSVDFFGVSGLTYVADFARWWASQQAPNHPATKAFLEAYPRPTLAELEAVIDLMCAGDYSWVDKQTQQKSTAHQFTAEDNAPYRCFQANYMLILLREIYGFPKDARKVTFALEASGEDLEWPLGALLHRRATFPAPPPINPAHGEL